ncbi:unnamed protein product, partial [Meganyctiphanes norvegica]
MKMCYLITAKKCIIYFLAKNVIIKENPKKNLANHVKKHSVEQIKCTKCEYTCKSSANLENHMKVHTGGEEVARSYSDTVKSPTNENNLKRGLSLSPEVVETDNKLLRSKQRNKKSKAS